MYILIQRDEKALKLLKCEENSAAWALDCLLHLPGELGELFRQVSIEYGWRLAGGYDLVVPVRMKLYCEDNTRQATQMVSVCLVMIPGND